VLDTVTAHGVGFVELGSAVRETLHASPPAQTMAAFQVASEELDDAELEEPPTTHEALKQ
jgi:hypothetical protein